MNHKGDPNKTDNSVFATDPKERALAAKENAEHQALIARIAGERLAHGQEFVPTVGCIVRDGTKDQEPWSDTVARMLAQQKR